FKTSVVTSPERSSLSPSVLLGRLCISEQQLVFMSKLFINDRGRSFVSTKTSRGDVSAFFMAVLSKIHSTARYDRFESSNLKLSPGSRRAQVGSPHLTESLP